MKNDTVPDWPQPNGIFETGTSFNPMAFLVMLRDVYEEMVLRGGDGGDRAMEYSAFLKLVHSRTIITEKQRCLFKLFDLDLPYSTPQDLLVSYQGTRYLVCDCIRD